MIESQLEKRFRDRVRRAGGRTEKVAPTTKGMPDRMVLAPGGHIYLVELKTETGRVSPAQREWHRKASALGTEVHVVSGPAEADAWVARYVAGRG